MPGAGPDAPALTPSVTPSEHSSSVSSGLQGKALGAGLDAHLLRGDAQVLAQLVARRSVRACSGGDETHGQKLSHHSVVPGELAQRPLPARGRPGCPPRCRPCSPSGPGRPEPGCCPWCRPPGGRRRRCRRWPPLHTPPGRPRRQGAPPSRPGSPPPGGRPRPPGAHRPCRQTPPQRRTPPGAAPPAPGAARHSDPGSSPLKRSCPHSGCAQCPGPSTRRPSIPAVSRLRHRPLIQILAGKGGKGAWEMRTVISTAWAYPS